MSNSKEEETKMKRLLTLTLLVLAIMLTFTGIALAEDLTASEVKAIKPSGFKASSYSYTKIKCIWNEIEGIDGYIVYRATSKNGKYTKAYTTSDPEKTHYINTNRTTGKTYYYKLRGYVKINGKTVYTKYSAVDDAYARPTKVKNLEVYGQSSGTRGVDLDWKAVTGATGYQQQINEYKDGKWSGWKAYTYNDGEKETFDTYNSLLKITKQQFPSGYVEGIVGKDEDGRPTTKKMTVEEYTLMSLSKTQARINIVEDETVHKFRVRAYHTEKGKKIYGLWSDDYTLTETLDINEIKEELKQYAIEYAAANNPYFEYDLDDTVPPEKGSYTIDGAFGGFSRYAKQEDVIEAFKDNIRRYITQPSRMKGWNPGYLYISKIYPGGWNGMVKYSGIDTYYGIWMLY